MVIMMSPMLSTIMALIMIMNDGDDCDDADIGDDDDKDDDDKNDYAY